MKCEICNQPIIINRRKVETVGIDITLININTRRFIHSCWLCSLKKAWEASTDQERADLMNEEGLV